MRGPRRNYNSGGKEGAQGIAILLILVILFPVLSFFANIFSFFINNIKWIIIAIAIIMFLIWVGSNEEGDEE